MSDPAPRPDPASAALLNASRTLRPGFGTESAVYGTILVSGLVALSSSHGETSASVLFTVIATVLVFWGAHVYAGTVARHGEVDGHVIGIGAALRHALADSLGMLGAAAIPCLILTAGTTRLIPDDLANDAALWSGVVILALLGYIAFLGRGSVWWVRLLGAAGTAAFGMVFIVLKVFVH